MGNEYTVFGIQETWLKPEDHSYRRDMTEEICTIPPHSRCKGFGGVEIMIQAPILHRLIEKNQTKTYQMITVSIGGMFITNTYISPAASGKDEETILQKILNLSRGPAMVMGDFNARNRDWDHRTNQRGTKLKQWEIKNGWNIKATKGHTCSNYRG